LNPFIFKRVGNVWHLVRISDLKEGDVIKSISGQPFEFSKLEISKAAASPFETSFGNWAIVAKRYKD